MDSARWERIQALFHQVVDLPEAERQAFLETKCDDAEMIAEVLALVAEDDSGSSVLDRDLSRAASALSGSDPAFDTVGPYRILKVLGRGGMGVVFLAERDDLHSRVAIKVLQDAALSPVRQARFKREQQTLAQLTHPSIGRLYDAGTLPDGTPYFVMEYVEGVSLTAYCRERNCSLQKRLKLFRAVCEAVQYAHRQAIVHRDIKPSNVLITDDGDVKLLDFGIAKQIEELDTAEYQTRTGFQLMTPAYAAPEQVTGGAVGVYTDIYALGVILYELLTGQLPFDLSGLTPGQVETRILEEEPERPSVKVRTPGEDVPASPRPAGIGRREWADLDVLCLTAMHKDPQRRYQTVESLIRDIDHFLKGEPLDARPDSVGYRVSKFLRRNRRGVTVAASAALLLLAMGVFHTVRLTEHRNLAQAQAAKAEQVSDYLISLFEAGDPYSPESENVDVRALLQRGEQRAEELAAQPALKAAMLNVLGRVYTQLSDFDRAEPLLQRALELRRRHGGPLDVAESLSGMANLLIDTGDYEGAEAALREARALRERHLPPNHPDLATNLANLGSVQSYQGRYAEAEVYHRLALRKRRAIHRGPHEEIGASLNALAVAVYNQGEYDAAERNYREALEVNRAVFGREHASVTRILANLGKLHEELGNFAAAESLLTEALRIRRATLGNDHFETAIGLGQLAGLYNTMGQPERAEPYLRESLAIRERILPANHQSIGTTVNGLALVLQHRGEYDEAEAYFRRAVEIYRESLGERHRFTGVVLSNLGHLFFLKGELGAAYVHFSEGLSILEEVHPEDHQELAHNRIRLGAVLTGQGRFQEAEELLLPGNRVLAAQLGADHQRTLHATERLVELYEAWEMPERAVPYRQALAAAGEEAARP